MAFLFVSPDPSWPVRMVCIPGILCENCVVVSGLMKMTCSLDVLQCRNTPGRFPLTTLTGAIWPDTNCNGTYCGTTWQKVVNISLLICVCVCSWWQWTQCVRPQRLCWRTWPMLWSCSCWIPGWRKGRTAPRSSARCMYSLPSCCRRQTRPTSSGLHVPFSCLSSASNNNLDS